MDEIAAGGLEKNGPPLYFNRVRMGITKYPEIIRHFDGLMTLNAISN